MQTNRKNIWALSALFAALSSFQPLAQPVLQDTSSPDAIKAAAANTIQSAVSAGVTPAVASTAKAIESIPVLPVTPPRAKPARRSMATKREPVETDQVSVVSPSQLTQAQEKIEALKKTDELTGVQLSIQQKNRAMSLLANPDNNSRSVRGSLHVSGIEGSGRNMIATVRYASGEEIEVRPGDVLPDGKRISAITSTGVSVTSGKTTQHVPIIMTSARASAAAPAALPQERVFVPMGGALPAPASR